MIFLSKLQNMHGYIADLAESNLEESLVNQAIISYVYGAPKLSDYLVTQINKANPIG